MSDFWKKAAEKYLSDEQYRSQIDAQAKSGHNVAWAIITTAKAGQ
jgi:hypothetical protein